MPNHFSFSGRVALLVGLMLVVSLVDFYRKGARAVKFREYGFILLTGAVGAVAGFFNDWITSGISPEYFTLGKGLEEGPDLRMQAALFGLRAGFSAGVIGGAVCLYASRRKSAHPPVPFSRLLRMLWMPVAGAILCGLALPLGFSKWDPARFSEKLDILIDSESISRFRQVWWTHVGLYAGMVMGLAAMLLRAAKAKKNPPAAKPSR
ncbi:MAG: hypothetical protein ABSC18_07765 [Verrucomicrobiota bacterium]|jgi:hypothetical protein